jgi:Uma2 family endonuclease
MAQHTTVLTAEDLLRMPDDGLHKRELVAGRLVTMTPAGVQHGVVGTRLGAAMATHVDAHRLGFVCGPDTGFQLASDPDTVRSPDLSFVVRSRVSASGLPQGYWQGAPDLAVEILSPGDSRSELRAKIAEYLRLGAREVWFVEPAERRLTIHGAGQTPRVLGEADTLEGGSLLPGFRYALSRLFSFEQ